MSDITLSPSDEALAVVEDYGEILAGAEIGRAYSGHTDRRYLEELEQAKAEIGRYATVHDDGSITPEFVKHGDVDFLAAHVGKWHGVSAADGFELLVDEAFVRFQLNAKMRRLAVVGSVSLDLEPEGRFPQDLGHPTAPKILFLAVDRNTPGTVPLYKAGEREYMAVWFQPNVDDDGNPLDRDDKPLQPRGRSQRLYCDDRYLHGYWGIVDWFADRAAAKTAMRELQDAVRTIGKPPVTADEPDEMREELLAADEHFDRESVKARRRQPQRPVADPFS